MADVGQAAQLLGHLVAGTRDVRHFALDRGEDFRLFGFGCSQWFHGSVSVLAIVNKMRTKSQITIDRLGICSLSEIDHQELTKGASA
ncbi:hypothetical protein MPL3365_210072 [Mesorhizobium plurifarium]|uniref:Uncharacterized protein n=1 Tax=Mesorhizobium plurifarium TaxID=69974 RepID=A0A090GAE6_MESPL|nr:hypothetical protein MPL3365_210072 [Mesorhizobium plurifarium]